MIDTIKTWVAGFPGFQDVRVDALGPGEGAALFPLGEQVLGRKRDILGGEAVRRRCTVLLRLHHRRDPLSGDRDVQLTLGRFARWAEETNPILGEDQVFRAEGAHLASLPKEGLARYEMKLIFEYTTKG